MGTDSWGNWKWLGVPGGAENFSPTKICTHVLHCRVFAGQWMLSLHPYSSHLHLTVALGLVLTNKMWKTLLMWALGGALCALSCLLSRSWMSPSVGDIERLVFILVDLGFLPDRMEQTIPAHPPLERKTNVLRVVTWVYFLYQLVIAISTDKAGG